MQATDDTDAETTTLVLSIIPQTAGASGTFIIENIIPGNTQSIVPVRVDNVDLNHTIDASVSILEGIQFPGPVGDVENMRTIVWEEEGEVIAAQVPQLRNALYYADEYPHSIVIRTYSDHGLVELVPNIPIAVAGLQLTRVWWTTYQIVDHNTIRLLKDGVPNEEDDTAEPERIYHRLAGDPFDAFLFCSAVTPQTLATLISEIMTNLSPQGYLYSVDIRPGSSSLTVAGTTRGALPLVTVGIPSASYLTWVLGLPHGVGYLQAASPVHFASVWAPAFETRALTVTSDAANMAELLGARLNYAAGPTITMRYDNGDTSGTVVVADTARKTPDYLANVLSVEGVLGVVVSRGMLVFSSLSGLDTTVDIDNGIAPGKSPFLVPGITGNGVSGDVAVPLLMPQNGQPLDVPLLYNYGVTTTADNKLVLSATDATARTVLSVDEGDEPHDIAITLVEDEPNSFMPLSPTSSVMLLATHPSGAPSVPLALSTYHGSGSLSVIHVTNIDAEIGEGWTIRPVYAPSPLFMLLSSHGLGFASYKDSWPTSVTGIIRATDIIPTLPPVLFMDVLYPVARRLVGGAVFADTRSRVAKVSRHSVCFIRDSEEDSHATPYNTRLEINKVSSLPEALPGHIGDTYLEIAFMAPSVDGKTRVWDNGGTTFSLILNITTT